MIIGDVRSSIIKWSSSLLIPFNLGSLSKKGRQGQEVFLRFSNHEIYIVKKFKKVRVFYEQMF